MAACNNHSEMKFCCRPRYRDFRSKSTRDIYLPANLARSASRSSRRTIFPVVVIGSAVDEFDVSRHFMLGQMIADEVADFLDQLRGSGDAVLQEYERLDRFGADRVGHADRRRHHDGGVPSERILDFGRTDAIAAAGDDIVGASLEPEITVFVATRRDRR